MSAIQACSPVTCAKLRAEQADLARLDGDAAMAEAAYQEPGKREAPPGYREVTDPAELAKLGLTPEHLHQPGSNFGAAVFKHQDGSHVVAFKGSQVVGEDWANNARQSLGMEAPYYTQAQLIASDMHDRGVKVRYVGHSLGGGLAAAAASTGGADASLFNPAALHEDTVEKPIDGGRIDRVVVRGEALDAVQEATPLPDAKATHEWPLDPPPNVGMLALKLLAPFSGVAAVTLAAATAVRSLLLHRMGSVRDALARRRNGVDQAIAANGC
ncbi:MAG: hypothetical protein AB7P02_26415 [Alphaproteobacteria bacterium]